MATIHNFEDLQVWQLSRELAKRVYKITLEPALARDFVLKDQMRRSSGSIMDNIAEGFGRGGNKEFCNFLSLAKGSATELKSQLFRALDHEYIDEKTFSILSEYVIRIQQMINKLSSALRNSPYRGSKFKPPTEN